MEPTGPEAHLNLLGTEIPVCRLCLHASPDNVNIFSPMSQAEGIVAKLAKHLSVQVDICENLPKTMCHQCWKKLNSFHTYYCEVSMVQGKLSSLLQNLDMHSTPEAKNMLTKDVSPTDLLNIEMKEMDNSTSLNYVHEPFKERDDEGLHGDSALQQSTAQKIESGLIQCCANGESERDSEKRSMQTSADSHKNLYRGKYSGGALEEAIKELRAGNTSLRKIAVKFNIPRSTLWGHYVGVHCQAPGRPSVLSPQEETDVASCLMECVAEWDFPLTRDDLQVIIQAHLQRSGRREKRFKDNLPSLDWVRNFLKRHEALSEYMCRKVKQPKNNDDDGSNNNKFFDKLENVLKGVPPENIIFFKEINFTDDMTKVSTISQRDVRVASTALSSVTSMITVAANGVLLRLHGNSNNWLDLSMFENWFLMVCLPYLMKLNGQKIVIGETLSTHLSIHIISTCIKHQIKFLFIPPHLVQYCHPVDVVIFPFLDKEWRSVVLKWRQNNPEAILSKDFIKLLRKALENIGVLDPQLMLKGLESCGMVPCDRGKVLQKLSYRDTSAWHGSLFDMVSNVPSSNILPSTAIRSSSVCPDCPTCNMGLG